LLELSDELLDHLNRGGTLIVPTRQRAAALRLAHSAAQLAAGHRAWNSPDVLPWSGWLERALDMAAARETRAPRRLSASEEWLCWREAVQAAGAESAVLFADALVDSVRQAVTLLDDYALPLRESASAESALLLGARRAFRERCAERGALGTSSWQDAASLIAPVSATRLVGFTSLGPARRRWLTQLGVRIEDSAIAPPVGVPLHACTDPDGEAEAAAEWCAGLLKLDPRARVLLVVPRLAEHTHCWLRALSARLDYRSILDPDNPGDATFALEGGAPLRSHPLLASALDLIALSTGKGDFDTLSALLRSPYLSALDPHARLRTDLWLREHNADVSDPALLRGLIPALGGAAATATGAVVLQLLAALAHGAPERGRPASPAEWAAAFAQRLAACGWPGEGLSSAEQQARQRFDELLNEFAAFAAQPRALTAAQACELLEQMAARSAFEPASDDIAVTLTASLDDPIVRYDGLWIAGLTADAWPQPARPDALIPMALQLAAGVPAARAAGQRQLALAALARWSRAARSCQWSWSRSEGDLGCSPSPLLTQCAAVVPPDTQRTAPFVLEAALAARGPLLCAWSDASAPGWDAQHPLPGGTRLLELQSRCPFRSFAELRLCARPLPQPLPGIDARRRGQILHRALQLFWETLRDSDALQQRGEDGARLLAQRCVAQALRETQDALPGLLPPRLLAAEGTRAQQLLALLRDWERAREPFSIEALEWTQVLETGAAPLRVRLDRVDRLADGTRIVIDYKSGAAEAFEPAAVRPMQPQLPAYALASGPATRAVVALQLAPDGLRLRGVSDGPDRLAGLRGPATGQPGWEELQRHWAQQLRALVREFLDGEARVAPQPGACEHCHLEVFCRIEHPRTSGGP
jgi:probable DNA repair protein